MAKFSPAEVTDRVLAIVATALAYDPSGVYPSSVLVSRLGASRTDFNHIKAELESAFSVRLGGGELDQVACGPQNEDPALNGGMVSAPGLARLRELIPEEAARIKPGLLFHDVLGLFHVQTLINLVMAAS
jgi:hypothetical protein